MGVEDAAAGQGGQALGAGLGLALGAGQNKKPVGGFYDPSGTNYTGYDPNATAYGGSPRGLGDYDAQVNVDGQNADLRAAPTANYNDANADRTNAGTARTSQLGTINSLNSVGDMQMKRAQGLVPSIASQVADRNIQQATAAQGAQQASARGAAGLALAGQTAAGNVSNATTSISNDAQINAATERLNAENAAANTYAGVNSAQQGVRAADLGAQGQDAGQAQFQAQQQLASRTANDQRYMGDAQLEGAANTAALAANTAGQGQLASAYVAQQNAQNQTNQANANTSQSWWSKLLSDERAKDMTCLGSGKGKMWSDENTKFLLEPLTKIQYAGSDPVGPTGQVQDRDMHDGDFKDPGAGNVMGELKADSDYATRYTKDPGSTSFYSDKNTKYDTKLEPSEEASFQKWFKQHAPPGERGSDYDYRGAYKAGVTPDGKTKHWPDTFKKPNHATFSNESQYAKGTDGSFGGTNAGDMAKAGAWDGNKFLPPSKPGSGKGIALSRGGADGAPAVGDPSAPKMFFDPVKGWQMPDSNATDAPDTIGKAALDRALQSQTQQDADDISVDRDLEKQNARDAQMFKDAVVAPGQAPKGYADFRRNQMGDAALQDDTTDWTKPSTFGLNKGGTRSAPGMASDGKELAPGTSDFDSTEPKPKQAFSTSSPSSLTFLSDNRVKLEAAQRDAFQKGVLYGGKVQKPGDAGEGDVPTYMRQQTYDQTPRTTAEKASKTAGDVARTFGSAALGPVVAGASAYDYSTRREPIGFHRDTPDEQGAIADANRSMKGTPYSYKPGFAEASGQQPGEVNVGPMAQNMEKSPVAGTAVKTDPATGLKTIDKDKAMKVMMSGIADLQRQQDETKASMSLNRGGR